MDDDTLDLIVISLLLKETKKCLDIITGYEEAEGANEESDDDNEDIRSGRSSTPASTQSEYVPPRIPLHIPIPDRYDAKFVFYYEKVCNNDPDEFRKNTRLTPEAFEILYNACKRELYRNANRCIKPKARLFITLCYLAGGLTRKMLCEKLDLPRTTAQKMVTETCLGICTALSEDYLPTRKKEDWHNISKGFEMMCHLPNCVGVIDIRTILARVPHNANSYDFCDKKGRYSFVILGTCDANYTFTGIDLTIVGEEKREWKTGFERKLVSRTLSLPEDKELPNDNTPFPHYFVGDSTCPLKPHIMRLYPGSGLSKSRELYNVRLLRAHQIMDNAYGVLTARWKALQASVEMLPDNMGHLIKATVLLHNFALEHDSTYCPTEFIDRYDDNNTFVQGQWRKETMVLQKARKFYANNSTQLAFRLRDQLCKYVAENPN